MEGLRVMKTNKSKVEENKMQASYTGNNQDQYFDHGFSWIVAVCSFFLAFTVSININCFGVLFTEFSEHFQFSYSVLSLLAAVKSGFTHSSGIVNGGLILKLGCRAVCTFGLICSALGCLIAAFISSFTTLILTFGFVSGFGTGLCCIGPMVVIAKYFKKKRVLATGLSTAGFSCGSTVLGLSSGYIIEALGWRHTLVLLAGLNVQCIVAVSLFFENVEEKRSKFMVLRTVSGVIENTSRKEAHGQAVPGDNMSQATEKNGCRQICKKMPCLNFDLFRSRGYTLFAFAVLPIFSGLISYYLLGPNRAYVQGVGKVESTFVSSALGFSAFSGRVLAGVIGNKHLVSSVVHYGMAAMLGGIILMVSSLAGGSLAMHLTFASLFGLFIGMFEALMPAVVADLLGITSLPQGLGCLQSVRGISGLITLPLAGWLFDKSGGFLVPFVCIGSLQLSGGLLVLSIKLLGLVRQIKPG